MIYASPDRIITHSWPGPGTGETIYQTAYGRQFVRVGYGVPYGYELASTMETADSSTARFSTYRIVAPGPEQPEKPKKPRYIDPAPRPRPQPPRVRTDFMVVQRPEFHARSNPR